MFKIVLAISLLLISSPIWPSNNENKKYSPNNGIAEYIVNYKPQLKKLFSLPFEDWVAVVLIGAELGTSRYDNDPTDQQLFIDGRYVYTMVTDMDMGRIVVSPVYSEENLNYPWRIDVSIVWSSEISKVISQIPKSEMKKWIDETFNVMKPDYTVVTSVFLSNLDDQFVVNYKTLPFGSKPIVDEYLGNHSGCFQECIVDDIEQSRDFKKHLMDMGKDN